MIIWLELVSNLRTRRKGAINWLPKMEIYIVALPLESNPWNRRTSTDGTKSKSKSIQEVTLASSISMNIK